MEDLKSVEMLVNELCASKGYVLYSFKYIAKGKTLEIVIDRDDPINLDDITLVSQTISDLLDEHDFTEDAYTLNVSSLGAEKPIDVSKLEKYVGKYVNIHLSNPYKGLNTLEGDLVSCDENELILTYKEKTRNIKCNVKRSDVDKARLAIKF